MQAGLDEEFTALQRTQSIRPCFRELWDEVRAPQISATQPQNPVGRAANLNEVPVLGDHHGARGPCRLANTPVIGRP